MNRAEFRNNVLKKLEAYAPNKSRQELIEAIDEFPDIVEEGYTHYQGVEYGCDYAAWNISMCI